MTPALTLALSQKERGLPIIDTKTRVSDIKQQIKKENNHV